MQALTRNAPWYLQRRCLASISSSSSINSSTVGPFQVFDRRAKELQRDRAAVREQGSRSRVVDYVRDEVADRMLERLLVSLPLVLEAGKPHVDAAGHQKKKQVPLHSGSWFRPRSFLQIT